MSADRTPESLVLSSQGSLASSAAEGDDYHAPDGPPISVRQDKVEEDMDIALGRCADTPSLRGELHGIVEKDLDYIFANLPSHREKEEAATNEANQGTSTPGQRIDGRQVAPVDIEVKAGKTRMINDNTSPTGSTTREANDDSSELTTSKLDFGVALDVGPCILGRSTICRLQKITTTGPTTLEFYKSAKPTPQPADDDGPKGGKDNDAPNGGKDENHVETLNTVYALELVTADGDGVLRREVSAMRMQRNYAPANKNHVLELVDIISTDLRSWSSEKQKDEAFRTGTAVGPILRILSPLLAHALNAVVEYYPGNTASCNTHMRAPYKLLIHHKAALEAYKLQHPPQHSAEDIEECNKHIDIALTFIESVLGKELKLEMARHIQNPPVATFEHYWLLLRPGAMVYSKRPGDIISPYVIKSVEGGIERGVPTPYKIKMWNIEFDGRTLGRSSSIVTISQFDGERPISSMTVYPVRFHVDSPGKTTMRDRLVARGKKYVELTKQSYRDYSGQTVTHPKRTYNTSVMIDTFMLPWEEGTKTYRPSREDREEVAWKPIIESTPADDSGRARGCTCSACVAETSSGNEKHALSEFNNLTLNTDLSPDQYFLCSYYVYGYVLKARKWEILDVECIKPRRDDRDFIDKLVISDENKHMIKAICRSYTQEKISDPATSESWTADFIQGKGEGQIFLLHGKPGVGKTLTAECVAEYIQRPLLSLTPADIGTYPDMVEQSLARYFKLGESWGAILLLDEADVYLEARNLKDLERNSLVSVFLHAMEYYQGILFLTTNRVGSFDEAFASRIHVHLHYGDLEDEGRTTIWNNLFEKLESEKDAVMILYQAKEYVRHDSALQALKWNGRQIRNAFQTAVSLAEYDASEAQVTSVPCKFCKKTGHASENCQIKYPEKRGKTVFLKQQHLEMVTNMSKRFQDYLESTKTVDDSKAAKINRLRDDSFDGSPKGKGTSTAGR